MIAVFTNSRPLPQKIVESFNGILVKSCWWSFYLSQIFDSDVSSVTPFSDLIVSLQALFP